MKKLIYLASIIPFMIAGCGGGGGGQNISTGAGATGNQPAQGSQGQSGGTTQTGNQASNSTSSNPNYIEYIPDSGTLVTYVQTPLFQDSERDQKIAYETLNTYLSNGGSGLLSWSPEIARAATNHSKYMATNGLVSHLEDPNKPGFTGESSNERFMAAGYKRDGGGEVIAYYIATGLNDSSIAPQDFPKYCVRTLLNTFYHAQRMIGSWHDDVGIGFAYRNDRNAQEVNCTINFGRDSKLKNKLNVMPAGEMAVYPFPGQEDAHFEFDTDSEAPRPSKNLWPGKMGTPINVSFRNADWYNTNFNAVRQQLDLIQFDLVSESGEKVDGHIVGVALEREGYQKITSSTGIIINDDPAIGSAALSFGPKAPLKSKTRYTVTFKVKTAPTGKMIEKTWSFKTI